MEPKDVGKAGSTKMLGGLIPEDIFWKFKEIASKRKESMQDAVLNAAMLYIDVSSEINKEGNK